MQVTVWKFKKLETNTGIFLTIIKKDNYIINIELIIYFGFSTQRWRRVSVDDLWICRSGAGTYTKQCQPMLLLNQARV